MASKKNSKATETPRNTFVLAMNARNKGGAMKNRASKRTAQKGRRVEANAY